MEKHTIPQIDEFVKPGRFAGADAELISKAFGFALNAHASQKRLSGEPWR